MSVACSARTVCIVWGWKACSPEHPQQPTLFTWVFEQVVHIVKKAASNKIGADAPAYLRI